MLNDDVFAVFIWYINPFLGEIFPVYGGVLNSGVYDTWEN